MTSAAHAPPFGSQAEHLGDNALLVRLKAEYESGRTHVLI